MQSNLDPPPPAGADGDDNAGARQLAAVFRIPVADAAAFLAAIGTAIAGAVDEAVDQVRRARDAALAQRDARLTAIEGRLANTEARHATTGALLDKIEAAERSFAAAERNLAEAARGGLFYRGVWRVDAGYGIGDAVTHGGSLYIARQQIEPGGDAPGQGSSGWQLAVKKGRDAERGR